MSQSQRSKNENGGAKRQRTLRYLTAVVRLNPLHEPDLIIARRARFLGIAKPKSSPQDHDLRGLRTQLSQEIAAVRKNFWTAELGALLESLAKLQLDRFPDLKLAAQRLQVVARNRHTFAALPQQGGFDGTFFNAFRHMLVTAPRDAASDRDDVINSIRSRQRLKSIRKMIRSIRKQMPEVYELEADWLQTVDRMRLRKKKRSGAGGSSFSFDFDFGGFGWVVWVLVSLIIRLFIRSL